MSTPFTGKTQNARLIQVDTKKPYHHGELPECLLDAAEKALEEHGPAGISLRKLGRQLGVTPGAPYRHFEDKDALLAALAAKGFRRLARMMREAKEESTGPTERFRLNGMAYLSFAQTYPQLFRLMFGWMSGHEDAELKEAGLEAFSMLLETLQELEAAGLLRVPIHKAALLAWSAVHGAAFLLIDGGVHKFDLEPSAELIGNEIFESTWSGIGLIENP